MKKLADLLLNEYHDLENMGFLYEFYPEATGDYFNDAKNIIKELDDEKFKKEQVPGYKKEC